MNLKALQILELVTYIAKRVLFWKEATKKNAEGKDKKEEASHGK